MKTAAESLQRPAVALERGGVERHLEAERHFREQFRDRIEPHEKGEFINGEIIMHSPSREAHNLTRSLIGQRFRVLIQSGRLSGHLVAEKSLCSFTRNDYEPDVAWFGPDKAAAIGRDTTIYPVPDFIVEIFSPATAQRDRGVKFEDCAAHGVAEYWIVDPDDWTIEQFLLEPSGRYRPTGNHAEGGIQPSFLDLPIPHRACFESAANLEFLKSILTDPA